MKFGCHIIRYLLDVRDITGMIMTCKYFYNIIPEIVTDIRVPQLKDGLPTSDASPETLPVLGSVISSTFLLKFPKLDKCYGYILLKCADHISELIRLSKATFLTPDDAWYDFWLDHWSTHSGVLTKDHTLIRQPRRGRKGLQYSIIVQGGAESDYAFNETHIELTKYGRYYFRINQGKIITDYITITRRKAQYLQKWKEIGSLIFPYIGFFATINCRLGPPAISMHRSIISLELDRPRKICHNPGKLLAEQMIKCICEYAALAELLSIKLFLGDCSVTKINLRHKVTKEYYPKEYIETVFYPALHKSHESGATCRRPLSILVPLDLKVINILLRIIPNLVEVVLAPDTLITLRSRGTRIDNGRRQVAPLSSSLC